MTTKRRPLKTAELKAEFDRLAAQWREETRYHSSSDIMAEHPAYQAIIAMGEDVIPLILENLRTGGGHWFMALRSITGESPIREEDRGKIQAIRAAWLDWGVREGYIKPSAVER